MTAVRILTQMGTREDAQALVKRLSREGKREALTDTVRQLLYLTVGVHPGDVVAYSLEDSGEAYDVLQALDDVGVLAVLSARSPRESAGRINVEVFSPRALKALGEMLGLAPA